MGSPLVLVTGAGSGIGRATVEALAGAGFSVVGGVRDPATVAAAVPSGVRLMKLDVTNQADIDRVGGELAADGARLVGLVNNAGVTIAAPIEAIPLDELRRQFEVNVMGPIALVQALLPSLQDNRGRVVMIGSLSSHLPLPFYGPYAASKAALAAATEALRLELHSSGVHVALVEPGMARTEVWRKARMIAQEHIPHVPGSLLHRRLRDLERNSRMLERLSAPPESVARVVVRALTDSRPRARYRAAYPPAAWAMRVMAMLPTPMRDGIVRTTMPSLRRSKR